MEPLLVAGLTLFSTLAAAALGSRLHSRLTGDLLAGQSALGLAATLTAVVLGIVTASAAAEFDHANDAVVSVAVGAAELGDQLKSYGPETAPIRSQLIQTLQGLAENLADKGENQELGLPGAGAGALQGSNVQSWTESIYAAIANLKPSTPLQEELRARALGMIAEPDTAPKRWAFALRPAPLPRVFLVAILVWMVLEFLAFGICSPRSLVGSLMIVVASVVVSSAVFLVLELKDPFTGFVRVSPEPLMHAIALVGR